VEPITALVQEQFGGANPSVGISVEGPGTGDGFARFCAGETSVADASRPIKDSEAETCVTAGIEYVELQVAFDGLTVLTSPENGAITCLDYNDLYALLGSESEGFETWADADALGAELGASHVPYPDAPLVVTAPGEESGTFDTFVELVIAGIAEERGADETTRADYSPEANDNVIVNNLSSNATSLGWVGYAFFAQNSDVVKAIDVDGGEGCVSPSVDTIADGSYPLSRPLFIYVKTNDLGTDEALVAFIDYYLSDEGIANVSQAGYVALPAELLTATRSSWESVRP
jgi:phosphate transport system substrate-binding protein